MREWIADLLDRSSDELDPSDRYSDWTGPLEAPRRGPEKREIAARCLAEAGRDPEVEEALAEDCERAVYYFGFESAIVARMLADPRLQPRMLGAMAAVGVPFRGPARVPAGVIAPLLASPHAEATMALLTQANFSEPANATGGGRELGNWRLQAFVALAEHDWQRLSKLLDGSEDEAAREEIVKLLLPSQIGQMPDSKALARITLEGALDRLRCDVSKASDLVDRLTTETAPAILDALFHRRFELASPPPYDKNNARNARAVLALMQANPQAFAQGVGSDAKRRQMLWDLFVKGLGYGEGMRRGHQLDAALGLKTTKKR